MSAQRLTDAQISVALRAHLPAHARSDVRGRITAEVATVRQAKPLPAVFSRLTEADPDARRRAMLLAAATLLVLGLAVTAAVGNLLRRDGPIHLLTADPASNPNAFVQEAYSAHRHLPAMTLVANMWGEEGSVDAHRFVFDGDTAVRHECCNGTIIIQNGSSRGSTNIAGDGEAIWVIEGVPQHHPAFELVMYNGFGSPDCQLGWRYVGDAVLLGRQAHHLACAREPEGAIAIPEQELWIDAELGIALQGVTFGIQMDENNQPVAPFRSDMEVVLFDLREPAGSEFEPPPGLPVFTSAELRCRDDPSTCEPGEPIRTPRPATTPEPGGFSLFTPNTQELVDETLASQAGTPAMEIHVEDRGQFEGEWRRFTDGQGALREEWHFDPGNPESPTVYLRNADGFFESHYQPNGSTQWRKIGEPQEASVTRLTLDLPATCREEWRHVGLERLLGRDAWRIACGGDEYWIDRERLLVVRHTPAPDPLTYVVEAKTVLFIEVGPQPPELFEIPEGDVVREGR
jgi:hypothetical protein